MGTEVMSVEERVKQQLAVQAQKASELSSKPNLISFKGGQLIVDSTPIPGGEADVLVLAQQAERAYYPGSFDPSKPQVPACYSFDLVTPHPIVSDPQSPSCEQCPQNKWGTAKQGRGKACRESVRVAVVPSAVPLEAAPLYQASFPITSMNSVRDFFARCASSGKMSGQFITQLKVVPDAKSFFKASLTPKLLAENQDINELLNRMDVARKQLLDPYPVFDEEEEEVPVKKGSKKY